MLKFLLVVIVLAVAIYFAVRVIQRRGLLPERRPEQRPFGPDDDPDFLRDLERKRRRRKPEDPDPSSP
ncbi:MAG TPA: hypothetical protein VFY58_10740 [Nocardioides sp.]|nr:hypothetical protein [Nocardioides sp.]